MMLILGGNVNLQLSKAIVYFTSMSILLSMIVISSCRNDLPKGPKLVLPKTWPIAALQPPSDAISRDVIGPDAEYYPVIENPRNLGVGELGYWGVAFYTLENHNELINNTITTLANDGWKVLSHSLPNGPRSKGQIVHLTKRGEVFEIYIIYKGYKKQPFFEFKIEGLREY